MAGKPNSRNWNDVQMVIIATALVLTLTLWNLFAGPDRAKADKAQNAPVATAESSPVAILPNPTEPIKIMLGGAAPNLYVVVPQKQRQNGGGGGGGGGGGTVVGGGGGTVGGGGGGTGGGGGGGGGGTGGS